eukprot:10479637-Heterocapsa_arctica.AAC.1
MIVTLFDARYAQDPGGQSQAGFISRANDDRILKGYSHAVLVEHRDPAEPVPLADYTDSSWVALGGRDSQTVSSRDYEGSANSPRSTVRTSAASLSSMMTRANAPRSVPAGR